MIYLLTVTHTICYFCLYLSIIAAHVDVNIKINCKQDIAFFQNYILFELNNQYLWLYFNPKIKTQKLQRRKFSRKMVNKNDHVHFYSVGHIYANNGNFVKMHSHDLIHNQQHDVG